MQPLQTLSTLVFLVPFTFLSYFLIFRWRLLVVNSVTIFNPKFYSNILSVDMWCSSDRINVERSFLSQYCANHFSLLRFRQWLAREILSHGAEMLRNVEQQVKRSVVRFIRDVFGSNNLLIQWGLNKLSLWCDRYDGITKICSYHKIKSWIELAESS